MKSKLTPVGDRIAVRRDDKDKRTKGGIIIPDNAAQPSYYGTVIAVGPGKWNEATGERLPPCVRVGDRVLFGNYIGEHFEVIVEDVKLICMHEGDLLAVVEE